MPSSSVASDVDRHDLNVLKVKNASFLVKILNMVKVKNVSLFLKVFLDTLTFTWLRSKTYYGHHVAHVTQTGLDPEIILESESTAKMKVFDNCEFNYR